MISSESTTDHLAINSYMHARPDEGALAVVCLFAPEQGLQYKGQCTLRGVCIPSLTLPERPSSAGPYVSIVKVHFF